MVGVSTFGFRGKLFGLVCLFALGLLTLQVSFTLVLGIVKVDGPVHQKIVREKELINDLTPPALYLRGPHFVLRQILLETDPARQLEMIDLFRRLERDYVATKERWLKDLPDGPAKSVLRDEVVTTADEYFTVVRRDVLPVIGTGQPVPKPVQELFQSRLVPLFDRQEQGVRRLLDHAKVSAEKAEIEGRETVDFWIRVLLGLSLGILFLVVLVGWWIARGIVNPAAELIAKLTGMADGAGDLTTRVQVRSADEIGQLATAINSVVTKIHDLVVKVRESSIQLYASSTEIAATAREQESTMQTLGASTNQIAAAVRQISATSQELSHTMNAVSDGGRAAGTLAEAGRAGLTGMADTMRRLADSTNSISSKLGVVREKASDITVVVTTITKVADQTNLLSINAAIEAEKAGEYGRGFLVVAREIRRLADQTAVATLDIENMVRQMQAAVSAGVMEMDKFTDEVRSGVSRVGEINTQMGQIIEEVHTLNSRFQAVNEGMSQQSSGAKQINDAMLQLAAGVQETSASLKEFHNVTMSLRESADGLKQQVARFTVAG